MAAAVLMAGAAATLAGCAGCAGCNNNTKNTVLTNSNWYTGTSYKGIQPSFKPDEQKGFTKEVLVYDVQHDGASNNSTYSAEYRNGTFTTEFYATDYDWKTNAVFPADENAENSTETVYYYKTELRIEVRFVMKTGAKEATEWFSDSVVNESYFRAAGKNLQPVFTRQVIKSTSPAAYQAAKLSSTYLSVDVTYENYYDSSCSQVVSVINEAGKDEERNTHKNLGKIKNTLFDSAYLYTAIRSMKLSTDFSQTVSLFSAANGGISDYTISGSDTPLGNEDRKNTSSALAAAKLYTPVTQDAEGNAIEDAGVPATAMEVRYTGGSLSGTVQKIWYASIVNADNNTARCTMLKISVPLSYNLGTLNYTLKEVKSTLWNK